MKLSLHNRLPKELARQSFSGGGLNELNEVLAA